MPKLTFSGQTARRRPIKPMPNRYKESPLRPNIEESDGIRPHFPMVPLRYLDVKFQDINTEQYVVIPKGRIISAITVQNPVAGDVLNISGKAVVDAEVLHTVTAGEDATVTFTLATDQKPVIAGTITITDGTETFTDDGEGVLDGSSTGTGTINYTTGAISITFAVAPGEDAVISADYQYVPSGVVYTGTIDQIDGVTPLSLGADDSYYGISRDICGIMVPANGGFDRTITYDASDVAAGVPNYLGSTAVVAVDGTYVLPANAPIGVAMYDVYQDIRGAFLNYELWKSYGLLAEQYIKLPFVDFGVLLQLFPTLTFVNRAAGATGYKVRTATFSSTADAGYLAAENKYSFLYLDSIGSSYAGLSGQYLCSDLRGNWVPQGAAVDSHTGIALNTDKNIQTVGRLLYVDTRFPKDLMDVVETAYGQRVGGTGTEGIPENLYDFVYTVLVASGYAFTAGKDPAKDVKELVQAGAFGYAYIQLSAR